jgi:hypothetical protein
MGVVKVPVTCPHCLFHFPICSCQLEGQFEGAGSIGIAETHGLAYTSATGSLLTGR